MICDTWAPESEKVTTERGCRIISSTWSRFSLARGCTKKQRRSRSTARSIIAATGSWPRSRASSATERCGPGRIRHEEDPLVVRPPRSRRRRRACTPPRWPPRTSLARTWGSRSATRCSSSGRRRSSRHSGSRSNGSRVSKDRSTESARLCTWANMRPPARAVSSSSSKYGRQKSGAARVLNMPHVTGTPVSTARSRRRPR